MLKRTPFRSTSKPAKCKVCRCEFVRKLPGQKVCGEHCALSLAVSAREKEARIEAKRIAAADRLRLVEVMPLRHHLKLTEKVCNKAVRLRDQYYEYGCISCEKPSTWSGQWHASHYKSVGSNSALRFNFLNIHRSCSICNNHLSGNISEYEKRLPYRIGKDKFEWLQTQNHSVKYSKEYLLRLRRVLSKVCKRYEKLIRNRNANS